jgi:hypothetical protein
MPVQSHIRFQVDPRDVPAEKAARRLSLSEAAFKQALPELLERGFPAPDPTTGHYDLKAIDKWMDSRHEPNTSLPSAPKDAALGFGERMERLRHG